MYTRSFVHKIRSREVHASPSDLERPTRYDLEIVEPRIDRTEAIDLYVKESDGWEPADGFSRRGVGSVVRRIRLQPGRATMEFSDVANQRVRNPTGMKIKFFVRPTVDELMSRSRQLRSGAAPKH